MVQFVNSAPLLPAGPVSCCDPSKSGVVKESKTVEQLASLEAAATGILPQLLKHKFKGKFSNCLLCTGGGGGDTLPKKRGQLSPNLA